MFDVWEFQDDFSIPPGSYSARPAPDRRGGLFPMPRGLAASKRWIPLGVLLEKEGHSMA